MAPLKGSDLSVFVKIAGLLSSDFEGERAAAAKKATEFLKARGLTWAEVLQPPPAAARAPEPPPYQPSDFMSEAIRLRLQCAQWQHLLTEWEAGFIRSLAHRRRITEKQMAVLRDIAAKLRGMGVQL